MTTRHTVVFTPAGVKATVADGTTVLEAARDLGVDLDTVCGGRGICGRCQVEPSTGEFPKWAITVADDALSPPADIEVDYRGKRALVEGHRLGCAARIGGNVVIDVPPESQIHRQVVRKEVNIDDLVVDPGFSLHYLELMDDLDAGGNENGTSITARIAGQLVADGVVELDQADRVAFSPHLLAGLHRLGNHLTVAISTPEAGGHRRVVAAWPGFRDRVLGVAIDIGSTTVAGHLCDLRTGAVLGSAGRMNPQIRFGEDLMSRVSYVMMNPGGDQRLTDAIRSALNQLIAELLSSVTDGERAADQVLEVVLVGNPVMHHIALGIDPTPLGQAPFPLATASSVSLPAADLDLDLPNASVWFAPCIAGHVGADTAAAIGAEKPYRSTVVQLLVDVGTNAEIVLGSNERLLAASSPTGPAFEGAQISGGQRATAGAIERVRIDRATLEPRFKVIGCDLWSDDPDFARTVGPDGVSGICGSGIIEVMGELFLAGVIDGQGVIGRRGPGLTSDRLVDEGRTVSYRLTDTVTITQADVRAIQLAKAALRAGVDLLLERSGWSGVDEVKLAGAFGAHIDPLYAQVLGLVPDCPLERVQAVGNAAGAGAVRALLSRSERAEMEQEVARVIKIETATEERFQDLFVAALGFPHATAATPHLAAIVDLPEPTTSTGGARRRTRRRS